MFCRQCEYDLRGLKTQRCPECGLNFDPCDQATYLATGKRRPRSRWLVLARAAIGVSVLAAWFLVTMGGASPNTSWEHHPYAGPFIVLKESRSPGDYAICLFMWACILAPALYWAVTGKAWAAIIAVAMCGATIALSTFAAASACC